MTDERLLTISTFARAVRVPSSALRYYAAEGILVPADVDPHTGYRYYAPQQIHDGVLVQQMRSAGVPVPVMRDVLTGQGEDAAGLIAAIIADHSKAAQQREAELVALRDSLRGEGPGTAFVRLSGAVLASALRQVGAAAVSATEDVSGLVWDVRGGHLTLIATDRFWLAFRVLHTISGQGDARAMTPIEACEAVADIEQYAELQVKIAGHQIWVTDAEGEVVLQADTIERAVPDLHLLVHSQPSARAVGLLDKERLQTLLQESSDDHVQIDIHAGVVRNRDGRQVPLRTRHAPEMPSIQMQSTLLASAISICPGLDASLGLVDDTTPVRVGSPLQDSLTALVMPMRP